MMWVLAMVMLWLTGRQKLIKAGLINGKAFGRYRF